MNQIKLVILDRDGTINEDSPEYIKSTDEWRVLPGAMEAIARLCHAGWHVVLVSNQSGLGRGLFEVSALNEIHTKMHQQVAAAGGRIDAVFFCPHAPDEACRCISAGALTGTCRREQFSQGATDADRSFDSSSRKTLLRHQC